MSKTQTTFGLVSIIVPCYNGARYLEEALRSCLDQTHREIEVIVVDDCSRDNTVEVAEKVAREDSRVRVIRRKKNGGISRGLNTGMQAARGEFIARLAQDDRFREDAVAILLEGFKRRPDAGLAYAGQQLMDESGRVTALEPAVPETEALAGFNKIGLCVMWRRAVTEKIGGFHPRFDTAEDFEYWLRIEKHFPLVRCGNEMPFFFRQHENMGTNRLQERQQIAVIEARVKYGRPPKGWRTLLPILYFDLSYGARNQGKFLLAEKYLRRAILLQPLRIRSWGCYAMNLVEGLVGRRATEWVMGAGRSMTGGRATTTGEN